MSVPFRSRPLFRKRSHPLAGLGAGSSFTSLGSLGVVETPVSPSGECTLENCVCLRHLAELVQSFDVLDDEAFTLGDFTVTPLARAPASGAAGAWGLRGAAERARGRVAPLNVGAAKERYFFALALGRFSGARSGLDQ